MAARRWDWERLAPLAGIVTVVLWFAAVFIIETVTNPPTDDATADDVLAYFRGEETGIYVSSVLFALGSLFFLWFVGSLRAALDRAEGAGGRVANIAFGAGVAVVVATLLFGVTPAVGAFSGDAGAQAAEALWYVDDIFFVGAEFLAIPLVLATALVAWRTGVLPRWLAILSILVAVLLLVVPIGWAGLIFGLPIWTVATSVVLSRRA
jgi:hypothetical protein